MHTHAHSRKSWAMEAGESEVHGYPWLCIEFKDSLGYIETHSLRKTGGWGWAKACLPFVPVPQCKGSLRCGSEHDVALTFCLHCSLMPASVCFLIKKFSTVHKIIGFIKFSTHIYHCMLCLHLLSPYCVKVFISPKKADTGNQAWLRTSSSWCQEG